MDIALVDDSRKDLESLSDMLSTYAVRSGQPLEIHAFSGGEALMREFLPHRYAIIFLDIYMEGISGIETAKQIRASDEDVCLVFLTTSTEHQAEAIHFHVFDYLNKDAEQDAVFNVMDRILRRSTDMEEQRLDFTVDRMPVSLPLKEVVYLTSDRNYLMIHDCHGREYRTRMTFSAVLSALKSDSRFVQILRGVIVNLEYIQDLSGNTCLLQGNIRLPVSIRLNDRIDRIWTNYTFAKIRRESMEGGNA